MNGMFDVYLQIVLTIANYSYIFISFEWASSITNIILSTYSYYYCSYCLNSNGFKI